MLVGIRRFFGYPESIFKKNIISLLNKNYFEKTPSGRAIKELSLICKTKCTPRIVFIPQPDFPRIDYAGKIYKKDIKAYSEKLGIEFIDTSKVLNTTEYNSDYPPRAKYSGEGSFHLSSSGYRKVSQFIFDSINSQK